MKTNNSNELTLLFETNLKMFDNWWKATLPTRKHLSGWEGDRYWLKMAFMGALGWTIEDVRTGLKEYREKQ